jgi:hypothetical protein
MHDVDQSGAAFIASRSSLAMEGASHGGGAVHQMKIRLDRVQ